MFVFLSNMVVSGSRLKPAAPRETKVRRNDAFYKLPKDIGTRFPFLMVAALFMLRQLEK